jgi:hypothetical protein
MKIDMAGSAYFCGITDKADVAGISAVLSARASEWFGERAAVENL